MAEIRDSWSVSKALNAAWVRPFLFLVFIVVAWDLTIRLFKIPPYQIPAPADVAKPPVEAVTSPSGLVSRIVTRGAGTEKPQDTDFVTVHYTGWTSEGQLFDSSHARSMPSMFAVNRVMAGWRECVLMMTVGETRRCWVPQDLAFKGQPAACRHRRVRYRTARRSPGAEHASA